MREVENALDRVSCGVPSRYGTRVSAMCRLYYLFLSQHSLLEFSFLWNQGPLHFWRRYWTWFDCFLVLLWTVRSHSKDWGGQFERWLPDTRNPSMFQGVWDKMRSICSKLERQGVAWQTIVIIFIIITILTSPSFWPSHCSLGRRRSLFQIAFSVKHAKIRSSSTDVPLYRPIIDIINEAN